MTTCSFIAGWGVSPTVFPDIGLPIQRHALPELETFDEAVDALAREVQPIVIAWSLGGLLATRLAARYPEKVKRLVLINTTPKFIKEDAWRGMNRQDAEDFFSDMKNKPAVAHIEFLRWVNYPNCSSDIFMALQSHDDSYCFVEKQAHWLNALSWLFDYDCREDYQRLKQPVLHILSERDAIVKTKGAELSALNASTEIDVIEDAGHMSFITHKNKLLVLLRKFLHDAYNENCTRI